MRAAFISVASLLLVSAIVNVHLWRELRVERQRADDRAEASGAQQAPPDVSVRRVGATPQNQHRSEDLPAAPPLASVSPAASAGQSVVGMIPEMQAMLESDNFAQFRAAELRRHGRLETGAVTEWTRNMELHYQAFLASAPSSSNVSQKFSCRGIYCQLQIYDKVLPASGELASQSLVRSLQSQPWFKDMLARGETSVPDETGRPFGLWYWQQDQRE